MKILSAKNYEEMSMIAARMITEKVEADPKAVLGFATGGTPKGTYEKLVAAFKKGAVTFQQVTTFNLDEYVGLPPEHPNSYHTYMNEQLFNETNIPVGQRFIPNGLASDLQSEAADYEKQIQAHDGIDLQLLGIGKNGHIGFNEPGTVFTQRTHRVALTPSTRKANARYFESMAEVPTHALTMGIQTILESKEILLLAAGRHKAEAVYRLITGQQPDEQFPASSLYSHPNLTLIADEEALSLATTHDRSHFS